jgi:hypothetical protein
MPERTINEMLKDRFAARHANAAVSHFQRIVEDYRNREWEDSITDSGRFVEAVLKALWQHAGEVVPTGRAFNAGRLIDQMAGKAVLRDSLRLTVPRACRFVYDIASNRGARHDADEVEANEMDASAVLATCSWVLAELVRYSQKGLGLAGAKAVVDGVVKRKYPFVEEIDGRVYVDIAKSAREAALLILWHVYPRRISKDSLIDMVVRHGYKRPNAEMAVKRLGRMLDETHGDLKLRNLGIREAEGLIARVQRVART